MRSRTQKRDIREWVASGLGKRPSCVRTNSTGNAEQASSDQVAEGTNYSRHQSTSIRSLLCYSRDASTECPWWRGEGLCMTSQRTPLKTDDWLSPLPCVGMPTVENRLPPLKRHDLEGLLSPWQRADNAQFLLFIRTARHWPLCGHIIQIKTCLLHAPLLVILSVGGLVTATECHETLLLAEEVHEQQISGTMSAGFTGHVRDLITMALLKT